MTELLQRLPYGPRADDQLVSELEQLTEHHRQGCAEFARIAADWCAGGRVEDLPALHVGLFKQLELRTEQEGVRRARTLRSSATSSGQASRVLLDDRSSGLQQQSTTAILTDFVGEARRPLLILDSARSLRSRELSARVAAALSLKPLSSDIRFLLEDAADPSSLRWEVLEAALAEGDDFLLYGFTWVLWTAWARAKAPASVRQLLAGKRFHFVHSGGWKKLADQAVDRKQLDEALLATVALGSRVIDYYGLVEQVGVIYPLCDEGFRHVPVWAEVVIRDTYTHKPLVGEVGQIQLLNALAWGAPYHSVLTEDLGRITPGACPCGRSGHRFEFVSRVPQAMLRGCANV